MGVNKKGYFPRAFGIVLVFLLMVVMGWVYYVGVKNAKQNSSSPKTKFQQYTNDSFGYSFSYPASDSLYTCPDMTCASIERSSLRVDSLLPSEFSLEDAPTSLMSADLFCSADGPNMSISCKNTKVENYTSSLGFNGFKVQRKKTVTGIGTGIPAGTYQDVVYVYPFPEIRKGPKVDDYSGYEFSGVIFAVDNPTQENLSELHAIADSFFAK